MLLAKSFDLSLKTLSAISKPRYFGVRVMSSRSERDDVLAHSYGFADGKSYDMIACWTINVASPFITASPCEHHNLAKPIITCRQAIIVD